MDLAVDSAVWYDLTELINHYPVLKRYDFRIGSYINEYDSRCEFGLITISDSLTAVFELMALVGHPVVIEELTVRDKNFLGATHKLRIYDGCIE